jgi:parallel beta-helix repeat protein
LMLAAGQLATAATLCVNPGASNGCLGSIGAAVSAAAAGDTIQVGHGTYKEMVTIQKSLALVGESPQNTVIDATGLSNGIFVDGTAAAPNTAFSNVSVSGFAIQNANFEGVLVANAASVTISGNVVTGNDHALVPSGPSGATCPGIYAFETASSFDCGGGIHLSGAQNSTVSSNVIVNNAGGILLSDDTGQTADNLITLNIVVSNPYDCGVALASHPPASITGAMVPLAVIRNTVAANIADHNGTLASGAGVGMFGFVAGAAVSGNVISSNILTNNRLPGVAIHGHATGTSAGENFDNNTIVGNFIAGNMADTSDSVTPDTAGINIFSAYPINGLTIIQNTIRQEAIAVVVNAPGAVNIHLNNFDNDQGIGILNLTSGGVNANLNWWNCSRGPGGSGCTTISGPNVTTAPWMTVPAGGI